MKAAVIAAGLGERLLAGGIATPKPLVEVGGKALVDHVLDAVAAAGIDEAACIFNAEAPADAVEAHCRARRGGPRLTIVRRTTPSSMESLFTLAPHLATDDRFLLLTVDAVFAPAVLRDFLAAAERHEEADAILAVTDFIDDDKPLHAAVEPTGRITALGAPAAASPLITAGFYVLHSCVLAEIDAAREYHFTALRQFLAHLVARDYRVYAAPMGKTVDVDRPQDIAAADAFVRGGFRL